MPIHKTNPDAGYNNYDGILNVNKHGETKNLDAHPQSPYIDHTAEISGNYSFRFDDYGLRRKTFSIGAWSMGSVSYKRVFHDFGPHQWTKTRSSEIMIRNDANSVYHEGGHSPGVSGLNDVTVSGITATQVVLTRRDGGYFDSSSFDSSSVSRGYLTIWYE